MTWMQHSEIAYNFSNYLNTFNMPTNSPNPNAMWYSWDINNIHFVSYDTEVFFISDGPIQEQYDWLEQDLIQANKNRDAVPWIIAYGHRPMYCSNVDQDDCTRVKSKVRAGLENLFNKYGVDVIFEAHEHSYERLWPVFNETVTQNNYTNPLAPVHLISGAAGCNEQLGICVNPILRARGIVSNCRRSETTSQCRSVLHCRLLTIGVCSIF
jgi:acid phosphatase type 7